MTIELHTTGRVLDYAKHIPLAHFFSNQYPDRWFRIHSLPQSKRYADNDSEWSILIHRHNSIITDVLGDGAPIMIITGSYNEQGEENVKVLEAMDSMKRFSFHSLEPIDLHHLQSEYYEEGQFFSPSFCETTWWTGRFDDIIRDMAIDNIRLSFVALEHNAFVAPYDGGIDFIVNDAILCNHYKVKYTDWLSKRKDSL
jgi:hypothetical protein